MTARSTEVLITGAGPTGLALALWLNRLGVAVRIIDKTSEPGTTSRALAVHARTLELYRQIGIADEVVRRGLVFVAINMWARGKHVARADFSDIGKGSSPFPYALMFPQDEHERLLIEHLERAGVEVERRTELESFEERASGVVLRLQRADGTTEDCEAQYLAGCDGAHSKARAGLGIGFPGGTYDRLFYVADVLFHGPTNNQELHVALDEADLVAIFPMKGPNRARLIGTLRPERRGEREAPGGREDVTWNDVSANAIEHMHITVDEVKWFSTYRVHHRVAEHFRRGRVFLLGDAAHIHSPVGGQGMNTGIGDAINLAWKLAAVIRARAGAWLLDTYEPERIAFAKRLVATTDRAFTVATKTGPLAKLVRLDALPVLAPLLMQRQLARRFMFRTISQTLINYRHSALSEGRAGGVRGGDRLPWIPPEREGADDNFTPLASLAWQLHVYGEATAELVATCARNAVPVHVFPWSERAAMTALARDAAYLVRPDGYVGWTSATPSAPDVERYLRRVRLS